MKKVLSVLLGLVFIIGVSGCSDQTDKEGFVIDLGGSLGEITLEGDAYGTYEVVEPPEGFIFEGVETTLYQDLSCNTPYIAIYRFAKGDYTLESLAQEEADELSNGYYQTFEDEENGYGGAYICYFDNYEGNGYYSDLNIIEDGDEFVEIEYVGKAEEIQIADTDVYAWVPAGYESLMDEDYEEHNTVFVGKYSEDYYFPTMFVGKWDSSYEYLEWYLEDDYSDGLPYTEEEYAKAIDKWSKGELSMKDYYKKLGDKVVFDSTESDKCKLDYDGSFYVLEGEGVEGTEAWFKIGDDWYDAWFESKLDPKPAYASAFLKSLHTK